jgi:hypothetical protein
MNTQATQTPLSSAQLDALLRQPDTAPADFAQHPELAALRSVLDDLRSSSFAAAERHRPQARPVSAGLFDHIFATGWASLAAAALVCAVAVPVALHHRQPAAGHTVAVAAVSSASPATSQPASTVSDEALLADIQADLNASVPSAMLPLSTDSSSTESTSTTQRNRE